MWLNPKPQLNVCLGPKSRLQNRLLFHLSHKVIQRINCLNNIVTFKIFCYIKKLYFNSLA